MAQPRNTNNPAVARRAQAGDTQQNFSRVLPEGLQRTWNGSNKYNRVCEIGRGAFATVYKVTMKLTGQPFAAKELDKRKFMKNGVLDQKVENEMKIMQRIKHVCQHPHPSWNALAVRLPSSSPTSYSISSTSTGTIDS